MFGLSDKPGSSCVALVIRRAGAGLNCHQIRSETGIERQREHRVEIFSYCRDWANERLDSQCQIQEVREAPYVPTTTMGKKSRRDCEKIWNEKKRKVKLSDTQSWTSYQETSADDYAK